MASIYFKRLEKKYGKTNLHNQKYNKLIREILAHNNEKIGNKIGKLANSHFQTNVKKLNKKKQKTIKLPDMKNVFPKRSVFLIKAAEKGDYISETLRTRLEKDLRDTIKEFQATGKSKMEIQRGVSTGKINPELIKIFQSKISGTFESYVKKDKLTGVPGNIKNIAVTEIRSTVGMIKDQYKFELLRQNPHIKMEKTWIHNKRLSKEPRKTHMALDRMTLPVETKFRVDKEDGTGYDMMNRPHDPDASPGNVIGCNCDIIYKAIIP